MNIFFDKASNYSINQFSINKDRFLDFRRGISEDDSESIKDEINNGCKGPWPKVALGDRLGH